MTSIQERNTKLDQSINKFLIEAIEKAFKTYAEKSERDYDSELEEELKDIIFICKPVSKNHIPTNNAEIMTYSKEIGGTPSDTLQDDGTNANQSL
ncbi:11297_t:CDS:2 [Diversispora eburnea]|uniref:11297_t:CDS:1 n=1 Tax=Diversispora eburnea TaxID=1213867 RepID=A0A9N9C4Q5_9GLOM|nr:11297_t:CDS:2 [Diversispora eburnea]